MSSPNALYGYNKLIRWHLDSGHHFGTLPLALTTSNLETARAHLIGLRLGCEECWRLHFQSVAIVLQNDKTSVASMG